MTRLARFVFCLGLGLLAQGASAFAQSGALSEAQPKVKASFIAEHEGVTPGGKVTVALRELIAEKWHTYWVNPGDSGAPTVINWQLPEGWTAAAPQFPYPERIPVGPLMNFGYENEVVLLNEITAPAAGTDMSRSKPESRSRPTRRDWDRRDVVPGTARASYSDRLTGERDRSSG